MAAKVSKNAREGGRAAQTKHYGLCGHELTRVKVVPVKGSPRFRWWCECDGYRPIENVVKK